MGREALAMGRRFNGDKKMSLDEKTLDYSCRILISDDYPDGLEWVNPVVIQHISEFEEMLKVALSLTEIRRVLEIGVYEGGTAYLWAQLVSKFSDGKIYGIDHHFGSDTPGAWPMNAMNNIPPIYRGKVAGVHVVEIEGRSEDQETIERLRTLLNGSKIDLLFHDGDHTYDGAKTDIENYCQFVKDGGLIAICDWYDETHGVSRYWPELKQGRESWEFMIQTQPEEIRRSFRWQGFKNGIGIVRWRNE